MQFELERGLAVVDATVDSDEENTVFGKRWGSQVFRLSAEELEALRRGKYIALDIQNEYVAYIQLDESAKEAS